MALRLSKAELLRIVKGSQDAPKRAVRASAGRKPPKSSRAPSAPRESAGEAALAAALRLHGADLPAPVRELVFYPGRRWRFDFAWEAQRVAVEVDGGAWAPGGGRHATDADRDKLNHAALAWRVLRFSPQQVERDPAGCVELVRRALDV